ncbi:PREDICTED: solute carrier family 17 member 9 [Cyphomyrmex costatus]|uniref:solute carrier family 17 member 9 n=1 Tax=Cyphomyrmex costatus TaxID=456900 RepID=UPI00085223DE|nr:PREDICTED: solute carrier family 17 member 9 [Cyphomyrmex costatus]
MQLQITLGSPFDDETALSWSRKERQKWFLSLLCGTCLIYATRTSVPLLIPVISQEKNWSKSDSGIILASFFWGYTLTQLASGYISDKIGGQRVIWISALGWSATTFLMPEVIQFFSGDGTSVLLVAVVRVINGAFQGMHFPSMISLISQRLHKAERASFFSLLTSGSALGTLLTGSLGSYLLENYNWITVFRALGSMSLAWTALLSYHSLSLKKKTVSTKSTSGYRLPVFKLLSQPPFWSCVIGHACQNNCFFVLLSWMPTYFHDNFPGAKGWIVNMVPWLSILPCTFLGKALSEIIRTNFSVTVTRKTIQTICFVIQIGSLIFLTKVEYFETAILCLALIIGGSGFHNNAIAVNPSDLAPKHSGSVFGLMNTVGAVPGFLGVYFSGHILHMTHSWSAVFLLIAVIDVVGCIMFLLFGSGEAII